MGEQQKQMSVAEIWQEAKDEFAKLTGRSLEEGPIQNFSMLEDKIKSRSQPTYPSNSEPEKGWDRAKSAGLSILKYLKLLVGVATQVSSLAVPGPSQPAANLCFNALTILLDIPQKVKDFDEDIDEIFTKVSPMLSRFEIYDKLDDIPEFLALQTHRVMVSFVMLCAKAVNLQQAGSWQKFKRGAKKSILEDDSGLKNEVDKFDGLTKVHHEAEGTITLEQVLNQKKDLARLLEEASTSGKRIETMYRTVQSLGDDADRTKNLRKIIDTFGIDRNVSFDSYTTQTCTKLFNRCLNGTGSWILDDPSYQNWVKKDDVDSKSVLLIVGGVRSGKTLAVSRITKKLEEEEKGTGTRLAHYFFPSGSKSSNEDDKYPVHTALKYMAFQLARRDEAVAKGLAKNCSDKGAVSFQSFKIPQLWDELKLGSPRVGMTYYLILDGVENIYDKHPDAIKGLLDIIFKLGARNFPSSSGPRVKVLISGTENMFQQQPGGYERYGVASVQMAPKSKPDMDIFIDHELERRGILQNARAGSSQQKARDLIHEHLPRNVEGSYSLLMSGLDNITGQLKSGAGLQELEQSLRKSVNNHETMLQNLQRSLDPDEVDELNELLKWIMFSEKKLSIDQLQAAMVLRSVKESLMTLEYIIEQKYSGVLKLEDGRVSVRDGLDEILRKRGASPRTSISEQGPRISATITITNVDQEMCQHFLWDLAHKGIRDKFKFDFDAVSSHSRRGKTDISVNEFDAQHTIVLQTFKFMEIDPNELTKPIGSYLFEKLPIHLHRLMEGGALRDSEKQNIGHCLFDLFESDRIFMKHKEIFQQFTWTSDDAKEFRAWFEDPAVVKGIGTRWLREARSDRSPWPGFFGELMYVVAEQWLRRGTWNAENAYAWVTVFKSMNVKYEESPADDKYTSASKWCQRFLNIREDELDSRWFEGLAKAAFGQSDMETAIKYYSRAVSLSSPSWQCYRDFGLACKENDDFLEAITQFEISLGTLKTYQAHLHHDMAKLHLHIGFCYLKAKNRVEAVRHYGFCLQGQSDEIADEARFGLLKVQLKFGTDVACRSILKNMRTKTDAQGQTHLMATLRHLAHDVECDQLFSRIFGVLYSDRVLLEDVVDDMSRVTGSETRKEKHSYKESEERGVFLYQQGVVSYNYKLPNYVDYVTEALKLWKQCLDELNDVGGWTAFQTRTAANAALCCHYFQAMKDAEDTQHLQVLQELSSAESDVHNFTSPTKGYLGGFHADRQERAKVIELYRGSMRWAIQILCDNDPDNDEFGYRRVMDILLHAQDFGNLPAAISFLGRTDLVTQQLTYLGSDQANQLGLEVSLKVRAQISDSSKQLERAVAARKLVETALRTDEVNNVADDKDQVQVIKGAYRLMKSKLDELCEKAASNDPALFNGHYQCGGLGCGRLWDYDNEIYFCVYCPSFALCLPCLEKNRKGESPMEFFPCNPKHKWIKAPRWGKEVYVGPQSTIVKAVGWKYQVVEEGAENGHILEMCQTVEKATSVQEWKDRLKTEWCVMGRRFP